MKYKQPLAYQTTEYIYVHKGSMDHKDLTNEDKTIYIYLNLLSNKGKAKVSISELRKEIKGKNPLTTLEHLIKYGIIHSYYRTKYSLIIQLNDNDEDLIDD